MLKINTLQVHRFLILFLKINKMNIDKFLYNITKPILGLLICLIFLPITGFSMLESAIEKEQLQATTACDFDAKLLIERSQNVVA